MDTISARQFREAAGADGWHAGPNGARIAYRTRDFARGARLVAAISELAEDANHHPDVDIRYSRVSLRLFTHSANGLTHKDVALATQISAAARELGIEPDTTVPQRLMIAVATPDPAAVLSFWQVATGYDAISETELLDRTGRGPFIWLQHVDKPIGGRMHLDIVVPRDEVEARVAAVVAAGGRIADDSNAPEWITLADADGHKVDICAARS
jgi:4a-hydroxytetrahydrobiopterin dehydratase